MKPIINKGATVKMKAMPIMLGRTLLMYVCYFPVLLLVGHIIMQGNFVISLLLLAGGSLLGVGIGFLRLKQYQELLASISATLCSVYVVFGISLGAVIMAALLYWMVYQGIRMVYGQWDAIFPGNLQLLGVFTYLFVPLLVRFDEGLKTYYGVFFACAFITIGLTLYRFNQIQLAQANLSHSIKQVPKIVKRSSQLFLIVFLTLLLVLALIKKFGIWLSAAGQWMVELINRYLFTPDPPEQLDVEQLPSFVYNSPLEEIVEPSVPISPFWLQVQLIILNFILVASIVIFTALIFYFVLFKLIPFVIRFISTLNHERQEQREYEDELEKLVAPRWSNTLRDLWSRFKVKPQNRELPTNHEEKVRYAYRGMLEAAIKDKYPYDASETPLESAHKLVSRDWHKWPVAWLTDLYNEVRYGGKKVSDRDRMELDRMRNH